MMFHQLNVFCFVKRTSTIRHFKRAYLSIIEQKISHSHLHAFVTNDEKMNCSKHFFFLSFFFVFISFAILSFVICCIILVCFNSFVIVHSFVSVRLLLYFIFSTLIRTLHLYVRLYFAIRTLIIVHFSDSYFVCFVINFSS